MTKKVFLSRTMKSGITREPYMISMASTKKVVTKGSRSVSQGQLVAMATIKAAVEIKNNNQYKPLRFLFTSMEKNFRKNRVVAHK